MERRKNIILSYESLSRWIFSKRSVLTRFKSASALRQRLVHYQDEIQRGDDQSGAARSY